MLVNANANDWSSPMQMGGQVRAITHAAAPQAFLLLFGGLFGTAGIALLGLLMLATWCALGLLLAALTRRALECRS